MSVVNQRLMYLLLSNINKRPVAVYSFSGIPGPLELTSPRPWLVGLMASLPLLITSAMSLD